MKKALAFLVLAIGLISSGAWAAGDAGARVECRSALSTSGPEQGTLSDWRNWAFKEVFGRQLTLGFTPKTHWLKISCKNPTDQPYAGIYEFLYPVVLKLNLYDGQDPGQAPLKLGYWDRRETSAAKILPSFSVALAPGQTRDYLIEAQSDGSLQLQGRLAHDATMAAKANELFFYGGFFGSLLVLLLYNLFLGASLRDRTYFYYCGYVAFFFLYQVTITGYAPVFLGGLGHGATQYRVYYLHLLFLCIVLFARRFLSIDRTTPWSHRAFQGMIGFYGIAIAASLVIPNQLSLRISALTSIIVPLILLVSAVGSYRRGFSPAGIFVLAWALFLASIVVTAMRNVGVLPKIWVVDHILEFGSLSEVLLISLGLAYKMRVLERQKNDAISDAYQEKLKSTQLSQELERKSIVAQIAAQVAHDVRSPLAVLNLVQSRISGASEVERNLLRAATNRLREIIHSLAKQDPRSLQAGSLEPQLLACAMDDIVSEKRSQYQYQPDIEIRFELTSALCSLAARFQVGEMRRVLSNLLNNAIEALPGAGQVEVSLRQVGPWVEILMRDQGKGIAPELLARLGKSPESHGKADGQGLGVFHAFRTIESWGGKVKIASQVGQGTEVSIQLPASEPPEWFPRSLGRTESRKAVVVDDDASIAELWRTRLEPQGWEVEYHSTGEDLLATAPGQGPLYLIDHEIRGGELSGLELGVKLGSGFTRVLVTSRWDESELHRRCLAEGMRLLPKSLIPYVELG